MPRLRTVLVAAAISAGMVAVASGQSYSNTTPITIPDSGIASPYPSSIVVTGGPASIAAVRVTLANVNHTYPQDVQAMLVAPNGARVLLVSNRGGSANAVNVTLSFDSESTNPLGVYVTGIYGPSGNSFAFSPPAPAGPQSNSFAPVIGSNANGTWQLWVQDSAPPDSGTIAGWSLDFYDPAVALAASTFTYQGRIDGASPGSTFDAAFTIWDSPTSSSVLNRIAGPVVVTGTIDDDGTITAPVAFGQVVPADRQTWLSIDLASPAGETRVPLSPRQRITPAPLAGMSSRTFYQPNVLVGTSGDMTSQHEPANQGVKSRIGYAIDPAGTAEFLGMQALVAPGLAGCGNSGDLAFFTWQCNTSPSREIMRINGSGNVGIGTNTPSEKLTVNGNVLANNVAVPSSIRFKDHVIPLDDALARLGEIDGVRFDWKSQWAMDRDGRVHDIGFVAEDVEKVFPEIVFRNEAGEVIGMDYSRMTAVAVSAIKQLKSENDALKAQSEALRVQSEQLKAESAELRARLDKLEQRAGGDGAK